MKEIPSADELKAIRKRLRLKQEEIAKELGITRIRWTRYEYGHSRIPIELAEKVVALDMGNEDGQSSHVFGMLAPIAVVGRAAAGSGETNVDPDFEPIYVPASLAKAGGLGFVIDGESMMPALQPGDIAVFKPTATPRRGYTFLIKSNGDEFRCKSLDWKNDRWTMVSLNPTFQDEDLGESQILGLLVGNYRKFGMYERIEADLGGLRLNP